MKQKEIFRDMKAFFKVNSLEEVAEKLGYSRATANNWRNSGITKPALTRFNLIKGNSNSVVIHGSNSGHFVNNSDNVNINSAPSDNRDDVVLTEFCELYEAHRTPQIQKELAKLTEILRKIKSAYDSDL